MRVDSQFWVCRRFRGASGRLWNEVHYVSANREKALTHARALHTTQPREYFVVFDKSCDVMIARHGAPVTWRNKAYDTDQQGVPQRTPQAVTGS